MADRIVGIVEAAERLNLNPETLQKRCRAGISPVKCRKNGPGPKAEWVFSDADLAQYVTDLFADPQTREAVAQ